MMCCIAEGEWAEGGAINQRMKGGSEQKKRNYPTGGSIFMSGIAPEFGVDIVARCPLTLPGPPPYCDLESE